MRNIILLAHLSLDGYMAGPDGDMSFITMDDEIGDHIYPTIATVDTAIYGRTTYQLMESYWPTITDASAAGPKEREHARWYKSVAKIVASRTLPASPDPTVRVIREDIVATLAAEKRKPGGDLMIFASPTLVHALLPHDVIDQLRLTIQPVVLGGGLPLFVPGARRTRFTVQSTKTFTSGVIAAHYAVAR